MALEPGVLQAAAQLQLTGDVPVVLHVRLRRGEGAVDQAVHCLADAVGVGARGVPGLVVGEVDFRVVAVIGLVVEPQPIAQGAWAEVLVHAQQVAPVAVIQVHVLAGDVAGPVDRAVGRVGASGKRAVGVETIHLSVIAAAAIGVEAIPPGVVVSVGVELVVDLNVARAGLQAEILEVGLKVVIVVAGVGLALRVAAQTVVRPELLYLPGQGAGVGILAHRHIGRGGCADDGSIAAAVAVDHGHERQQGVVTYRLLGLDEQVLALDVRAGQVAVALELAVVDEGAHVAIVLHHPSVELGTEHRGAEAAEAAVEGGLRFVQGLLSQQ